MSETNRRTDKGRFADGTPKVVSDMSAEERSFARSAKYRKKLRSWMDQNSGESWSTMGELHRDAANYAGCAMMTASRWIYQYTGPGQRWQIIETEDAFHLAKRTEAAKADRQEADRLWAEGTEQQDAKKEARR